ncbi:cytoplasmic dynein 2 heavy chain 1 [Phymastichus coffea]|uniref:cytoplasmic dynein 2 heavy chain 1 n=1 Tax=Phymastichus coffea TaxID=108790 RepID=UPI00273CF10B|nr:cytoplasmic dynein 2 heavy chain 1 [Phymastichus coffea]
MVAIDKRQTFVVATAHNFFGVPVNDQFGKDELDAIDKFLDEKKCRTLCAIALASPTHSGRHVKLTNNLSFGENTLVFFKISDSTVTEENFHEIVQVTSISKNSVASLAEALRQVWSPALQSSGFDSLLLKRLENQLLGPRTASSLLEEETHMREKSELAKTSAEKKLYEQAVLYLKNLRRELESAAIAREGLVMLEEILDTLSGHLDDLWKLKGPVYNEERMQSLLEVVGTEIAQLVQTLISKVTRLSNSRAKDEAISYGAMICKKWMEMTHQLTSLFWPNLPHAWKAKSYKPEKCHNYETRLKEIAEIRAQNRQLTRLLTPTERANLGTDVIFKCFDNIEELLGEENDVEWDRLRDKLRTGLGLTEERVAAKLRALFTAAKTPLALETEFRRYSELMRREAIRSQLKPERQALLSAYADLIDACMHGPDTRELLDTPEILQKVQTARVAELRLESLQKLGKQLLSDLPGYDDISGKLTTALNDAERQRQELTETWVEDTKLSVQRDELSLGKESAVVELCGAKLMRVNFDPRLTALIRESRGLAAQGVELPREIKELVERASSLTGRARALQQIANFHNTIGDRMIPSQRPLMLASSLELAGAVREQSGVIWTDARAIDVYTNRLRELVKKFARQNAELASKHAVLRDLVCNLLKGDSINLVTNQNVWKDTLRNMRDVVDSVEAHYGNTKAWKLHWDRQLLKALGIAYRAALPTLLKKLPEIRVELTFRDENLHWRPTLEDTRMKLYSGIRRFLAIPTNFRGVGNPEDGHFHTLVPRSAYLFGAVYREAENLLNAFECLRVKWLPLVSPAKIDIGQTLKGKQSHDWEKAFKDAKQWAQEVNKLRATEIKISCIVIDISTIRNDLELLSRRYWERLALDLRAEASSRLVFIIDFLSSASKKLSHRARTIEEIGEAYEAYSSIKKQSDDIARELEDVSGLGRVLAAWTRDKLDGLSNASTAWDSLKERLDNYHDVMLHQLEEAKLNLRHQVLAMHDDQERWKDVWASRPAVVTKDWLEIMRERWINLIEQRDVLVNDCKRLNLPVDEIFESNEKLIAQLEAELETEELNNRFQSEFIEELQKHEEEEWSVARRRLPKLHEWLDSWESRLHLQMKNQPESLKEESAKQEANSFIERKIVELRDAVECVQLLRAEDLAEEHWNELNEILELGVLKRMSDITLGHLLKSAPLIKSNLDRVKDITKRAAAESGIRQALIELEAWESYTSLPLLESKDSRNIKIHIVGDYSALLVRAGELRLILEGARGAAGYERFASRAARCEAALSELEERIKILSVVQRKWIYLDPVYSSGAAPNDSGRWTRADKEFRYFMGEIAKDPKIPSLRKLPFHALTNLKDLLDRCQRSLDDFLEEKRSAYPRLYFLSDEDLLELVSGKGKGIDVHLSKLYQGISSSEKELNYITSVISPEGEKLKLLEKINLTATFPQWLINLENGIRNALQQCLNTCLLEQTPDISAYPTQILLLCERIRFTEKCEMAMDDDAIGLKNLLKYLENQRTRYRSLEDPDNLSKSLKAKNLLLETVHHLHVVRNLLEAVTDKETLKWNWSRQVRTYKSGGGALIRCAKAEFPYRFEYQGAAVGLVRTPLTEKCYLALTQAMKLGLGGSPTGPAGTGKTESVKALGSILGRRVLVFNCDEGMDSGSMRRILSGLAQAGTWGCFDEFNRLEESTMSAVAMLIRPLQEAVRDGATRANLGGLEIPVNPHCCLFITMNPAADDYGGRHKLPDSLARLFRPIGMAHPNKTNIVRSLLECAGFVNASRLANQLVETFDTAEKLLSKQPHYDWGLRALRSVLNAIPLSSGSDNESIEVARMLSGIYVSTMPKLVEEDAAKFLTLLNDIFPNTDVSVLAKRKDKLQSVLANICEVQELHDSLIRNCTQLNDQLHGRSGVAIVGPPGCGKTLIIKILAEALLKIGEAVKLYQVYPGAISKSKLLGSVDSQTRELKEGLMSNIISNSEDKPLWIVLNGDVEPEWAEALNSALDDNRILTLPNGVGIKLRNDTRLIFESHKLSGASPATVSRLGIVFLREFDSSVLLNPSFLKDFTSIAIDTIMTHLSDIIEQVLKAKKDQKSASGLLKAALVHFQIASTQASCTQALLASVCSQIKDHTSRDDLARKIYHLTGVWCPDSNNPCDVVYNKQKDILDSFTNEVTIIKTEEGSVYLSGSMQRGMNAILPWIKFRLPVILRGPTGCGKNALLNVVITSLKNETDEAILIIKSSSLYGSKDLITRLKRSCIKLDSSAGSRQYRSKNGSRIILVVEDLHLASQNLQELIRQLIQEGGFYEDDLEFAKIPLTILTTGDLSTKLHPRLDSLLATLYLPSIKLKDLDVIVDLHLRESLKSDQMVVRAWISKMSPAIVEAFNEITNDMSKVKWTPRDLMTWIDLLKYYPETDTEGNITGYLIDASRRLFRPKLQLKQQKRLETIVNSRTTSRTNLGDNVYVWKGANNGLTILSNAHWKADLENAITRCIREGDTMSTNIFSYLMEITAGISWGFGCEQRGILLTGRPGAARKSATKIVSIISCLKLIDSAPGKGKSAVKSAVQAAGIEGEWTILLLEEHHLREDDFAILISGIIANGEVPGLYTTEELDGLIAPLSDLAAREEFPGSLEQFLYYRLRKYLKVVLIVDLNDLKEAWFCQSNLLLYCIQTTGQNLGNEWWLSESSLIELASLYKDPAKVTTDVASGVVEVVQAHINAPIQQQAPARFLALLNKWKELRESWINDITAKLKHLEAGIERLKEAGDRVAKLEEDASKQRRELEIEKGKANAALEQITATMRGATGQRTEMASLKSETERESIELARRKADIESELGSVEPLVEQASQAVANISSDALSEVRSLRAPPAAVRDVLEGVLRLMGIRDTSWNSMKTFLAKRGVKEEIRNWDARRSSPTSLDAVAKLIKERPESFDEKTAKRASVAAAPLAAWVLANLQYGQILQQVAPLEREQRVLTDRLAAAEAQIGKLESGLNTVESKVAHLQEELAAHTRGAAELQLRMEATEASLNSARSLLSKLDAEHSDWRGQFQTLTERNSKIDVEAATLATLLIYQNPATKNDEKRKHTIDLLITERDKLQWRTQGLPVDTESFIGAARAIRGNLVPLFLDPLGVAVNWLRFNIGETRIEITRPEDSRFLTSVELAVRFGKPLLVEEIIELPTILLPLLRKRPLRIGDKSLPAQQGFQLFLATRQDSLTNKLPSEADATLVKISLGIGSRSLTERLVIKAILQETPEIEMRRKEALEREEQLSGEIEAARLELLVQLGEARGQDILQESRSDGAGLLATLELTQSKAKEIAKALEESRRDLENINKRSKEHERLAIFTAIMYKFVRSFSALSSLYVFTTETITEIFLEAERSRFRLGKDEREKTLEKTVTSLTLHHCIRAAYRKHRLPMALHLAISLNSIPDEQRSLLMSGEGMHVGLEFDLPDFISSEQKSAVRSLITTIPTIAQKLKSSWVNNIVSVYAENNLNNFEKILVIQALHPEHLHTTLSKWASQQLGVRNLTPPSWTLKQIAEENAEKPILLLLSPGADPELELSSLIANQIVLAHGFVEVSLGQDHVGQAESALELACKQGSWILLSNLQLALNWLPRLEALLRSPSCTTHKNPNTRIWLSTEECSGFYPGLSGLCLKLAYEPPEGVKRNIKRSLQQLQQREPPIQNAGKSLMISWLHATLQERRKFVPQSWIKAYAWSEADLEAACELVIQKYIAMNQLDDDWEADRGILDVAVYGGLLQDEYDMRILRAILKHTWSKDVYLGRRKLGGILSVPKAASENPLTLTDRLDDTDPIQMYFGLPANAHRAWEKSAAELSLRYLREISRRTIKISKENSDGRVSPSMSKTIRELKLMIDQQRIDDPKSTSKDKEQDPLRRFFSDEINTTRQLLQMVRSDLDSLRSSDDLKTPKTWIVQWNSGPQETIPFVNKLVSRYQSLMTLSGLPSKVELSWFARPDAFFSALKQHTARQTGKAFENLRLKIKWTSETDKEGSWRISVLVQGLLLTGARIDNGILDEVTANASSAITAPPCLIAFVDDIPDENDDESENDVELTSDLCALSVPVYTDSFKNHLICALPVPYTREQQDIWHQRGISFHLRF